MNNPLWTDSEWTWPLIEKVYNECYQIGTQDLKLNIYENQFEIVTSEQMLDAYTSIGMPIYYQHWSFGKHFIREQKSYQSGNSGLAYELVVNTNPCINYLMEDNTMTTQALVIAHAGMGHNHFFKNNYLFKQWTDADAIIDYLIFARDYVNIQEKKHGRKAIETWLDSCHALMDHGVNRYKRPGKLSLEKEKEKQRDRLEYMQSQVTDMYRILPTKKKVAEVVEKFPQQPEENLLYFFEKYAPDLEDWQRELLRIVRKISQYYLPQGQTKILNEGFASLTHYEILNRMHDQGLTTDGSHLEFLALHSSVLYQPTFDKKYYNGLNPYALGFAMLQDIQRMTANPTAEDLAWFPIIKNNNGWDLVLDAVDNYRDESFIRQWLSPNVIRNLRLFSLHDDRTDKEKYQISAIHNEQGYQDIREKLADQNLRASMVPQLEVINTDRKTRTITIQYTSHRGRQLDNIAKMMPHIEKLWGGFPVVLQDETGVTLFRSRST